MMTNLFHQMQPQTFLYVLLFITVIIVISVCDYMFMSQSVCTFITIRTFTHVCILQNGRFAFALVGGTPCFCTFTFNKVNHRL